MAALGKLDEIEELKLASAEFINKWMILLSAPTVSDDTIYRVYLLFDKLQKGYMDETTFQPDNPIHQTLAHILEEDDGINPDVRKLFLALYESYTKYCNQLISDSIINREFNKGMQIGSLKREFGNRLATFAAQLGSDNNKQLFPPESLTTVLAALDEAKSDLANKQSVDVASLYVILSFVARKASEPTLIETARELKQSMDHATNTYTRTSSIQARMKKFGHAEEKANLPFDEPPVDAPKKKG